MARVKVLNKLKGANEDGGGKGRSKEQEAEDEKERKKKEKEGKNGTIKVWDAGVNADTRPQLVKSNPPPRIPGAQGGEAEHTQQRNLLCGLQP